MFLTDNLQTPKLARYFLQKAAELEDRQQATSFNTISTFVPWDNHSQASYQTKKKKKKKYLISVLAPGLKSWNVRLKVFNLQPNNWLKANTQK